MRHLEAIEFILHELKLNLSDKLIYHCLDHTKEVVSGSEHIAKHENVSNEEMPLLLTAAAFHDTGFLEIYEKHEEISCEIVSRNLPKFGFNKTQIESINELIRSTRIPQTPKSKLAKILCDADLGYFGGSEYNRISNGLYEELKLFGYQLNDDKWLEMQISFLETHHFWTEYAMSNLTPYKQEVLRKLKDKTK